MYKKYLQKLEKLKGTQRIELAIIDDINKPLDKARTAFANIQNGLREAASVAVSAAGDFDKAARVAAVGVKKAKELGVSSDIVKLFSSRLSEAEFGYKDASSIAKQIQKITSKL